jgi:phage terminase small subunit
MKPRVKFKKGTRPEAKKDALALVEEYGIEDAGGLVLIQSFADAFTTELACQEQIKKDGLTILDRYGKPKSHPLLPMLRDSRAQKLAALKMLHLDVEPLKEPGRPAGR